MTEEKLLTDIQEFLTKNTTQNFLSAARQFVELLELEIIDKEIGEVLKTTDETRRQALYKDLLTRLHNDAVYLPISYVSMMVVAKPELGTIPYAAITAEIPFEQIRPEQP